MTRLQITRPLLPLCLLAALASPASQAHAQALPVTSVPSPGFQLPDVQGSLHYAVSASEVVTFGYNGSGDTIGATSISGDLGYLSNSDTHPFSLVYSGGYLANTEGQPSSPFQNLALSQILNTRRWHFTVSDSLNYLPYSPISGLSGIAGVGDLTVAPIDGSSNSGQGVLTDYSPRISNIGAASLARNLTGSTTLDGSGSFSLLRFVGDSGSGIESNQVTGMGGLSHRLNALSSVSGNYTYSKFSYLSSSISFLSQGANLQYVDQINRRLSLNVSAGPQWTTAPTLANASVNFAASLHLAYSGERTSGALGYARSTNAGSGVTTGGRSDNLEADVSRRSSRAWNESVSARYTHSTSLAGISSANFTSNVVVGSFQVNRQLGRAFSAFASYTVDRQSIQGTTAALTPFNGVSQVLGIGLTYSPGLIHLGHR